MGFFSGLIRIVLAILNFLLFVGFFAIAIVGLLLKFKKQFLVDFIHKAASKWPKEQLEKLAELMQIYGSSVAIALIILGFFVAIVALIGIFALLCKVQILAYIYIVILSILAIIEFAFIIYAFAIPNNLYKLVNSFMNATLKHIGQNDSHSEATLDLWSRLGSSGETYCCGEDGIQDFYFLNMTDPVPTSCCLQNYSAVLNQTEAYNCTYGMALNISHTKDISGCKNKTEDWIDTHKTLIVGVPSFLFAFHILVLIGMIVLSIKWRNEIYYW